MIDSGKRVYCGLFSLYFLSIVFCSLSLEYVWSLSSRGSANQRSLFLENYFLARFLTIGKLDFTFETKATLWYLASNRFNTSPVISRESSLKKISKTRRALYLSFVQLDKGSTMGPVL